MMMKKYFSLILNQLEVRRTASCIHLILVLYLSKPHTCTGVDVNAVTTDALVPEQLPFEPPPAFQWHTQMIGGQIDH